MTSGAALTIYSSEICLTEQTPIITSSSNVTRMSFAVRSQKKRDESFQKITYWVGIKPRRSSYTFVERASNAPLHLFLIFF